MIELLVFIAFSLIVIFILNCQYQKETGSSLEMFTIIGLIASNHVIRITLKYILELDGYHFEIHSIKLTLLSSVILYLLGALFYMPLLIKIFKKQQSDATDENNNESPENK